MPRGPSGGATAAPVRCGAGSENGAAGTWSRFTSRTDFTRWPWQTNQAGTTNRTPSRTCLNPRGDGWVAPLWWTDGVGQAVPSHLDCAEPERVARFWCEVLGYVVPPPPEGFASWDEFDRALPPEQQGAAFACVDPSGGGPRLFFQRVPEGKVVKNRLHLDVRVGTGLVGEERLAALEAECARLVALGAVRVRLLPADGDNESCLVMQDIEGNEFCLD